MPARAMFPELQRLDAAIANHQAAFPNPPLVGDITTYRQTYEEWRARRADLADDLAAVLAEVGPDLCGRCSGTGLTDFARHHGMCYLCQGDGWSARGRRRYRAGLIAALVVLRPEDHQPSAPGNHAVVDAGDVGTIHPQPLRRS